MDAVNILGYGHKTFQNSLSRVPENLWHLSGACGVWSVKDIIAHLASYEHILIDVLNSVTGGAPGPYLQRMGELRENFNDVLVNEVKALSAETVLADYNQTFEQSLNLARQLPADIWAKNGTLPWYGDEYVLDDYIVYTFYGHKREHSAQIDMFRDRHVPS